MSKRKKAEPSETNFLNATADAVPGYSSTEFGHQIRLSQNLLNYWVETPYRQLCIQMSH